MVQILDKVYRVQTFQTELSYSHNDTHSSSTKRVMIQQLN